MTLAIHNTACADRIMNGHIKDDELVKLSKRLSYVLRYGAEKEGLNVLEGGYVELLALFQVPMLRQYDCYQVLNAIEASSCYTGTKRFESKKHHGVVYVRAVYGRRMERNACHEGTQVHRLLDQCMQVVCKNLDSFDLTDFPDEFLLNTMIHRLKRQKRLTNRGFRALLSPTIEHLDLGGVYLTETTLRLTGERCGKLKVLNLRDCGYMLHDHYMEILLKRLTELETLNLSACHHLTDRTLRALQRHCPRLMHLNATRIPAFSQEAILDLVFNCIHLCHLDIYDNRNITDEGRVVLETVAEQKNVTILLRGFKYDSDASRNASLTLALASCSRFW